MNTDILAECMRIMSVPMHELYVAGRAGGKAASLQDFIKTCNDVDLIYGTGQALQALKELMRIRDQKKWRESGIVPGTWWTQDEMGNFVEMEPSPGMPAGSVIGWKCVKSITSGELVLEKRKYERPNQGPSPRQARQSGGSGSGACSPSGTDGFVLSRMRGAHVPALLRGMGR